MQDDNNKHDDMKRELPQFRRDPNAKVSARKVSAEGESGRSVYSYVLIGSLVVLVAFFGFKHYLESGSHLADQRFTKVVQVKVTDNGSGVVLLKNVMDIFGVRYTIQDNVPHAEAGIFVEGKGRMEPLAFFSMLSKYKKVSFNKDYSKHTVILYGSKQCSRTLQAMNALDGKGVPYVFVDLSEQDADIQGFYARFIASGYDPARQRALYPLIEYNDEMVNYPEVVDVINRF